MMKGNFILGPFTGFSLQGLNYIGTQNGLLYSYKRFVSIFSYNTNLPLNFKLRETEFFSTLELIYNFEKVRIKNFFKIGKFNNLNINPNLKTLPFTIRNTLYIYGELFYSPLEELEYIAVLSFNNIPDKRETSYYMILSFFYLKNMNFSEIGLKAFFLKSAFLSSNSSYYKGFYYYDIEKANPLNFYIDNIINEERRDYYFNTILSLILEYRIFPFKSLNNASSNIFLVLFNSLGIALKQESLNPNVLFTAGIGAGYKIFGSTPLNIKIGLNQDKKVILSLTISPISFSL